MNHIVRIGAGGGYNVTVGEGLLDNIGQLLDEAGIGGRLTVIADSNVAKLYLDRVTTALAAARRDAQAFVFPAGEASKTLGTFGAILEFFAEAGLTRGDCAIALGGGVTGDMTGFAAGCYMRGIAYVQLPTTLLAAVDSSVGGKTAIDLRAGKNLAGLFIQPRAVWCDTDTLATLPAGMLAAGAAEAIKTGVLGDVELFNIFESGDYTHQLRQVIVHCVAYKGQIISQDERESGPRMLLNLGHTPAHGIEKLSGYAVPHGEAVATGLAIMTRAAYRLGYTNRETASRILEVLKRTGLPVSAPYSSEALAQAALSDKKRSGGEITIVIPRTIGECSLETVPVGRLAEIFTAGMEDLP